MAGLQAAVALVQVERLDELSQQRRQNMTLLKEELEDLPEVRVLPVPEGVTPTRFALETMDLEVKRDETGIREENPLAEHLRAGGIEARYPYAALHTHKDAGELDTSMLKMSHRLSKRLLLLPFLPPLGPGEMARIGRAVRSFFGR
jgi:dTDP-4-amino-4,6-dideoxygalactose transaminase